MQGCEDQGPGQQPGMCPNWELNWWPFGLCNNAQSTDSYQSGPIWLALDKSVNKGEYYLLAKAIKNLYASYLSLFLVVLEVTDSRWQI